MQTLQATQNNLHEILEQNEGRQISLLIIKRFIDLAGHVNFNASTSDEGSEGDPVFIKDRIPVNAFVYGEDDSSSLVKSKKDSDSLHLRFQTPKYGVFRDCKNTLLENNTVYEMSFYVDKFFDLRCLGVPNQSNVRSSAVLAHKIEKINIEYAYLNSDTAEIEFCDANCIDDISAWTGIKALRLFVTHKCSEEKYYCESEFKTSVHTLLFKNSTRIDHISNNNQSNASLGL